MKVTHVFHYVQTKQVFFKFYFSVREEVKDAAGKWRVPFRAPLKFGHQNVRTWKASSTDISRKSFISIAHFFCKTQ